MADPQIEKLLIVQDRDLALQKLEQELARIPVEKAALEKQIAEETANIEAARQSLKQKEVERHDLDNEVKSKETAVQKFRTQQMEVKKNEEYRALTQQIEQTEAAIAELEEKEIALMLEIDELQADFQTEKGKIELRIQDRNGQIAQLAERAGNLEASLGEAQAALALSREGVEDNFLENYDRVRKMTKRPPYVVQVEAHKCGGCHLRVSNDVAKEAMHYGEPHYCDQCARIVYI
ncbi:zinc ribbon domain-containing protein [Coraliomargarita parva]|uniref:zinc ribbon domain-containing protein n=1 Tax=Coraliomargarita parva TaxID=3014050 RepID=UPI0022B5D15F|nr:C4-type zinc ribbon domain-containing protein [Coraliomargarita parva]